jgi:hypothetical protein
MSHQPFPGADRVGEEVYRHEQAHVCTGEDFCVASPSAPRSMGVCVPLSHARKCARPSQKNHPSASAASSAAGIASASFRVDSGVSSTATLCFVDKIGEEIVVGYL